MASMGFCLIALITVINLVHGAQTDRNMTRALNEMVQTVEAVHGYQREAESAEPEWRVESYVEEAAATPEAAASPEASQEAAPEESASMESDWWEQDDYQDRGKGKKKRPWWYEDFLPAETAEASSTPEAVATPTAEPEETVIHHYYYYYPEETEVDLRTTAMNQYAGRLCVVSFAQGQEPQVGMSDSNALSPAEAVALAERMRAGKKTIGDLEEYRYEIREDADAVWVYFLDCSTERNAQRSLLLISILVGLAGLVVTGFFVYFMSKKAIEPLKESMEKQKRFITDAGHELKTPLAVIGTNMDILEMDIGKNKLVDGTKKQLTRLRKLVANLISLSKLEEMREDLELHPFCLSDTALECVDAFAGAAEVTGRDLTAEIQPGLMIRGDVMTVGQMLTILCDNAVKYAEGDITVRLYESGKRVCFETENPWNHGLSTAELSRLFDRFYRGDSARTNTEGRSGYGLGLSIAKAIAEKNQAQITAEENYMGNLIFRVTFRREK